MKLLLLLLIIVVALSACHKDKDEGLNLPYATHRGANTFGCYVDGKPIVVSGNITRNPRVGGVYFDTSNGYFEIDAYTPDQFYVCLTFKYFDTLGRYELTVTNYGLCVQDTSAYYTNNDHMGSVTVTNYMSYARSKTVKANDTPSYIAGTFAFDAINEDGKVVHITDGRFDVQQ